jgi:hypothetical protein
MAEDSEPHSSTVFAVAKGFHLAAFLPFALGHVLQKYSSSYNRSVIEAVMVCSHSKVWVFVKPPVI